MRWYQNRESWDCDRVKTVAVPFSFAGIVQRQVHLPSKQGMRVRSPLFAPGYECFHHASFCKLQPVKAARSLAAPVGVRLGIFAVDWLSRLMQVQFLRAAPPLVWHSQRHGIQILLTRWMRQLERRTPVRRPFKSASYPPPICGGHSAGSSATMRCKSLPLHHPERGIYL